MRLSKIFLSLQSGEPLFADGEYLRYEHGGGGKKLIKFSKKSQEQLQALARKGYQISKAEIRFIVAWKPEDETDEHAVVLPTLYMKKSFS